MELLPVFPDKDLQPSLQVSLARTFQKGQLISLEGILRYCESEEDALTNCDHDHVGPYEAVTKRTRYCTHQTSLLKAVWR